MPQVRHVKIYPSTENFQLVNTDVVTAAQAIGYLTQITKNVPTAEVRGWSGITVQADVTISDLQLVQEKIDLLKQFLAQGTNSGLTAEQVKTILAQV